MKEFSSAEKWVVILLIGVCYAILVRVVHHVLSAFSEGLAGIVVFLAIIAFIWYVFFNNENTHHE